MSPEPALSSASQHLNLAKDPNASPSAQPHPLLPPSFPASDFEMLTHSDESDCSHDRMDIDSDTDSSVASEAHSVAPEDPGLNPWSRFDEFQDLDEPVSREEMLRSLRDKQAHTFCAHGVNVCPDAE
jgi:hypothetical protein